MISYFEYDGIKSNDIGMRIYNNLTFSSAVKDITEVVVPGRNGTVDIDNKRMNDIEKSIMFDLFAKGKPTDGSDGSLIFNAVKTLQDWIDKPGYKILRFSMYPGYYFKAKIQDPFNVDDTMRKRGRGVLRFKIYPVMYKEGQSIINVINGINITNDENMMAYPKIYIESTAPSLKVFNNGALWINLQNLEGKITIDSELKSSFDDFGAATDKMIKTSPYFPLLNIGDNNITIEGDYTKFTLEPRLGRRAII